jgi:hypothetical protein
VSVAESGDIYIGMVHSGTSVPLRYPIQIGLRRHGGPQALPGGAKPFPAEEVEFTCEYSPPKVLFFHVLKNN